MTALMEPAAVDFGSRSTSEPDVSWSDLRLPDEDERMPESNEYRDTSLRAKREYECPSSLYTDCGDLEDRRTAKRRVLEDPSYREPGMSPEAEQSLAQSFTSSLGGINQQPATGWFTAPPMTLVPVVPVVMVPVVTTMAVDPSVAHTDQQVSPPQTIVAEPEEPATVEVSAETLEKRHNEIKMIREDFPAEVVEDTPIGRAADPRMTKRPWEEVKALYRHALKVTQLRLLHIGNDDLIKLALELVHRQRMHAKEHVEAAKVYLPQLTRLVGAHALEGFAQDAVFKQIKETYTPGINEADHLSAVLKALKA